MESKMVESTPAAGAANPKGSSTPKELSVDVSKPTAAKKTLKPSAVNRKMTAVAKDIKKSEKEFPHLSAVGLYAAKTKGDGNCLFYALSEQMFGDYRQHLEIRQGVIEYIRANAEYYKPFVDASNGTASRRQPRRGKSGSSRALDAFQPNDDDVDRVFEAHLQRMAKSGTYADNMEIQAFAQAFNRNVKIYEQDKDLLVHGGDVAVPRETVYIAHHDWEHYSTIRNVGGPHEGLPNVTEDGVAEGEEGLMSPIGRGLIMERLKKMSGDADAAAAHSDALENGSSSSSSQGSSKRGAEEDSDDEEPVLAHRKRFRKVSRRRSERASYRHQLGALGLGQGNGSQASIVDSAGSQNEEFPSPFKHSAVAGGLDSMADDDDDEEYDGDDGDSDWRGSVRPRSARVSGRRRDQQRKQAHKNARKQRAQQDLPIRSPGSTKFNLSFSGRLTITI